MADIPCPDCGEWAVKWRYKQRGKNRPNALILECEGCGASKYWNGKLPQ